MCYYNFFRSLRLVSVLIMRCSSTYHPFLRYPTIFTYLPTMLFCDTHRVFHIYQPCFAAILNTLKTYHALLWYPSLIAQIAIMLCSDTLYAMHKYTSCFALAHSLICLNVQRPLQRYHNAFLW